ncbi:MAG: NifB/NifX family molybdenum-iron cluster-binding protein [Euryarchaeota archaeon]|jgi:predicted Fe-Mo cluster-binding NifX family protein|nr:NifB/NifX family molybdenum-iron cluster-binding protein [Euryarchaeota archaeon]
MKVSIPVMNRSGISSTVGAHFGKVPVYAILETETGELSFIDNTSEHMGGVGLPPELLSKAGVNVMLCGGLGPKAVDMFTSLGIEVYVGAKGTVKETLDAYKEGKLVRADHQNACQEHHH